MLCWTATVYCRGVCIGDFVRQYCPSAKTLPNADNRNRKYLTENGDALVGKLIWNALMEMSSVIFDASPDGWHHRVPSVLVHTDV